MYMYYGSRFAGPGPGFGLFWPIAFVLFIILIVWIISTHMGTNSHNDDVNDSELPEQESALEILKKRYARGEITKRQYLEMKKDIS